MLVNKILDPNKADVTTSVSSTLSLGAQSICTCISYVCNSFFYTPSNKELLNNKKITQKIKECLQLIESQQDDIRQIHLALNTAHTDLKASYHSTQLSLISYQSEYLIKKHIEIRKEILDNLIDLLDTYPELDDSNSIDTLINFHKEREKHHQRAIVKCCVWDKLFIKRRPDLTARLLINH